MIREFCTKIYNNKNSLMMLSVLFYVMALFGVMSNNLLWLSLLLTIFFIYAVIKNLFPAKVIIFCLFLFYLGVVNTTIRIKTTDELYNLAPVNSEITGIVTSIPKGVSDGNPKFYFDVKTLEFGDIKKEFKNEKLLVTLNLSPEKFSKVKDIKLYNTYKFTGRLSIPFKAGNPSQFDYGNYLRNYDTYAVFYAKDFEQLNSSLTFKQKILQKINEYRERIIGVHSEYLRTPNLEILGGIVFGDDAVSPPKNIKQSFVNSGLLHILAASGMNVAFIWGFFSIILSWFRVNFKLNVSLGILAVLIYLLMTGMGAS
ncbi:MAG: ComEC family competence protein, partial [bacterium]|nr:ComEC family competence protein [bacterium]